MWSLLWTRLHRRVLFWAKLFSVAFIGHVLLLFIMLFVYSGQKSVFTVNINRSILKSGAPIIFMPLKRSISKNICTESAQIISKKPVVKKAVSKKAVHKNTLKKKSVLRQAQDEREKKAEEKKKPVSQKKKAPVKKPVKKVAKKPVKKVKKSASEKKFAKPKIKNKTLEKKNIKKNKKKEMKKEVKNLSIHPEAIYIGQQELEALKIQNEIESEVAKHWRAPVGLSKDLACTISVIIDWGGSVKKVTVTKSSGALMFDIAARTAIGKSCIPRSAYGKEVNINFG